EAWLDLLSEDVVTEQQAIKLIDKQWTFLLRSKLEAGNPTFILLNGSTNYFSAIMLKLVTTEQDNNRQLESFNEVLTVWKEYLTEALNSYLQEPLKCDEVSFAVPYTKLIR